MSLPVALILIVLLIGMSAFFSGSEIAFASANKVRLKKAAQDGSRSAACAMYISEHFTSTLSTILLGNNLVNLSATSLATLVAASLIRSEGLAQTVATTCMTLLLLIFGEIVPKVLFMEFSDTLVTVVARPLRWMMWIFTPITRPVDLALKKLSKFWTPKDETPSVTAEELVTIVDEMEETGEFTEEESDLIRSAIEFNERTAKDILTPRVDTMAFDLTDPLEKLIRNKDLLSYSRFPVYEDTLDKIVGILSVRDFVRAYFAKGDSLDIRTLLVPPLYVHMTREISSILPEMKETGCEMAVVLDEFGGTLGILTAEDIVEEIVGEIFDEGDEVENDLIYRGNYMEVAGSMPLHEFFDQMEMDPIDFESEYTTVGGFATEQLNRLPEAGDRFQFENLQFLVAEVDENRVEKLLVKETEPSSEDQE